MTAPQLAFVFPGQGSQKVGMLAEQAAASDLVHATFAEASEVLGYDLWQLVQTGPQEELNLTERMLAQIQWLWEWNNNPAPGAEKNDNLIAITFGWGF